MDSSGNVYVADAYNHRIQVFAQHNNTPPNTTITSAIDGNGVPVQNCGSTSSNQITFQLISSDGTPHITFQCSLDNSAYSNCVSPLTYTIYLYVSTQLSLWLLIVQHIRDFCLIYMTSNIYWSTSR
jgi:hypothetical protein